MSQQKVETDLLHKSPSDGVPISGSEPTPTGLPAEQFIIKREAHKDSNPTVLAFVIDDQDQQPQYSVTVVKWSAAAAAGLKALREALGSQAAKCNIPSVSLRGRLELADQTNLRLDRDIGLFGGILLWTQTEASMCAKTINNIVLEWLINDVADCAQSDDAQESVARLKSLARAGRAIEASVRIANPYQWTVSSGNTAKAISKSSYADLADYVVRQLEGKSVFPQLSGLRRIASGQLEQNQAELMTEPIQVGQARFSLVVRIRVFSYPGRELPVITIHFSRRIWTSGLKSTSRVKTMSGYAVPEDSTRAFRFTLRKTKGVDGSWSYQPEGDFAPITRRYFPGKVTVDTILKEGHRLPHCKLLVGLKHGTGERSETKSGVPDLDKMDGFRGIAEELAVIGLIPWQGLREIKTSTRPAKDRDQHWGRRDSEKTSERKRYDIWLKEAQESIRECYAGTHHLIIGVQPGYAIEADARLAEERLQNILGNGIVTERIPISPLVHGPRYNLPGKDLKNPAERAAVRFQEWSQFVKTVQQYEIDTGRKVDGVLIIAREWYPSNQGNRHDDNVNQRAARIALANGLGVPVQYLRPREEFRDEAGQNPRHTLKKSAAQLEDEIDRDFENRLMISWLDLAYKSIGRVRPSKLLAEADNLYGSLDEAKTYPDRILALGLVRRNKNHFLGNERSILPFAIELDVVSGVCSASFAYEDADTGQLTYSNSLPLPQALVLLASLGPTPLTSMRKEDRAKVLMERSQAFFKDRLADFGRRSLRPLVIVDADTSRSVWPWLTDNNIDPKNVQLDGGFHAEAAWSTARLVRVRTDNSPKVLWDNEFCGVTENTKEMIRYHAPSWAEAQLFKLTDTDKTDVYLSFGSAIRTGRVRGRSSYREIPGMKMIKLEDADTGKRTQKYKAAIMERYSDAWTTPAGLEILVVRPDRDDPDQVAKLVEWLRQCCAHFGEWTVKPAPLFFERVLKEYIADYNLGEDEDNEDEIDEEE